MQSPHTHTLQFYVAHTESRAETHTSEVTLSHPHTCSLHTLLGLLYPANWQKSSVVQMYIYSLRRLFYSPPPTLIWRKKIINQTWVRSSSVRKIKAVIQEKTQGRRRERESKSSASTLERNNKHKRERNEMKDCVAYGNQGGLLSIWQNSTNTHMRWTILNWVK